MSDKPDKTSFLPTGSKLSEAIVGHDWSQTPLGNIETWPQSLRTALSIMLNAHYPINVYWGTELINFYNDAYLPIIGKKHPSGLGKPLHTVWPEVWDSIEPLLKAVLENGESFFTENVQQFVTRSGFNEEIFMTFSYGPLYDGQEIAGVFAAGTEVTGSVIGERRLRVLRRLGAIPVVQDAGDACQKMSNVLDEAVEDVPFAAFYLREGDGGWSLLAKSGYSQGEPSPPEVLTDVAAQDEPTVVTADSFPNFPFPNGPWEDHPHRAWAMTIPVDEGEATVLLIAGISARRELDEPYRDFFALLGEQVARNVTQATAVERERMRRRELEDLDRAKNEFLSTVSHEFRTPLTLILGPLESALEATDLDDSLRQHLQLTSRNARRLMGLVENMLQFSRIQAGKLKVAYHPLDLAQHTRAVAAMFESSFDLAGLQFDVEVDPLPMPVYADSDLWDHILSNLLSNALKFTQTGGVKLSLHHSDAVAVLEVKDTGSGIEPDQLPHIFERFHHVVPKGAKSAEGAGIGLSLVDELVRLHGGSIDVDSTPGKGSTFRVTLPYGKSHLNPEQVSETAVSAQHKPPVAGRETVIHAASPKKTSATGRSRVQPRVLVIDDNADMRQYLEMALSVEFDVTTVPNTDEARKALSQMLPDVIVSDVMLPGVDGLQFVRQLRTEAAYADLPILLVSARGRPSDRIEGLEAGADDYLAKPFEVEELRTKIRASAAHAMEIARRERRLRKEAESAERMKSKMLTHLSHEFRTPLTKLMLQTQLAERRSEGKVRDVIQRTQPELQRLQLMLESVIEMNRLQSGAQLELDRPFAVAKELQSAIDGIKSIIEERGLDFQLDIEPAASKARCKLDQNAFKLALQNLISNAVKFTEEGRVTVSAILIDGDNGQNRLRIEIEDTGAGIDEDFVPSLFSQYSYGEDLQHKTHLGLGIGLTLVEQVVEQHGGRVNVQSSKGKGSTFFIDLPVTDLLAD